MRMAFDRSAKIPHCESAMTWLVCAMIALCAAPGAQAGPIPLYDANGSLDNPQPHGPGDGLLVDHQPHNTGGFASDTMAFEIPGGSIVAQYVADDFQLAGPSTIRRIKYHGFYNYGIEPTGSEVFAIKFHEPRPGDGLPGNVLFETTVTNPLREWTGRLILDAGAPREYKFTVDLDSPLNLPGGQKFWLSIYQIGDSTSSFRWEHSVNGEPNGDAFNNQFVGDWTFVPWPQGGNNAFQLFSTPELSSGALLFLGVIGLGRRRRGCRR